MSIAERAGRAFDLLKHRRLAYILTFQKKGLVRKFMPGWLRRAYRYIFLGHYAAQEVLIDLARFCRANESTYHPDPVVQAALMGRREVWLRLSNHLNLSSEQLFALYNGNQFSAETRKLSEGE